MPFIIPVLALCIPIVAILSKTYAKTHNVDSQSASDFTKKTVAHLEEQILALQKDNLRMAEAIKELEEKQNFLTRLIEDKSE